MEGDFLFGKEYAIMMVCLKGPLLCCFVFRRELLIGEKQMLKVRLAIEKIIKKKYVCLKYLLLRRTSPSNTSLLAKTNFSVNEFSFILES